MKLSLSNEHSPVCQLTNAESSIRVEVWHGLLCYEKSEMEDERTFPMSEEGRTELHAWLKAHIAPEELA